MRFQANFTHSAFGILEVSNNWQILAYKRRAICSNSEEIVNRPNGRTDLDFPFGPLS